MGSVYSSVVDEAENQEEVVARIEMCDKLNRAIQSLNPRSQEIIRMRMDGHTLREIGNKLGIHWVRVHQIEYASLKRLSHPKYKLRIHLD